jgi:hypothetical protein
MEAEYTTAGEVDRVTTQEEPGDSWGSRWGGRVFILVIVLLASVMGAYAVWHKHEQGRRSLEFWGAENAGLIRHASMVQLLVFHPDQRPADLQDAVESAGGLLIDRHVKDISKQPGLVHARHMLIEDSSYRWDAPAGSGTPGWTFALSFQENEQQVVLAFDTSRRLVQRVGSSSPLVMGAMLGQLEKYLGLAANLAPAD